ncbi:hypothetical protein G9A89_001153 [Geosiphon pyriformis]|nr:hypothetical protein G9A89_001153 [Geosiphon pyriformis]
MAPQQLFHALSHDFESLLNSQNFSDVRIIVGEAPNTRTFHVHSQILAARSSYFAIALSGDWPLRFSRSNFDSKLLQSHNIKQLDHWIQGKDKNTPLKDQLENEFKLLLRGSRDGFSPNDFHRLCDNKGATVTVIKVKGTGQLIGGYNPESWHSRWDWIDGKESFIFSLGDGKAQNAKLSKFISKNGPFCHKNYGPEFGSHSIRTYSSNFQSIPCSCKKETNYEHVIMPGSENTTVEFFFDEYEVFQIINN